MGLDLFKKKSNKLILLFDDLSKPFLKCFYYSKDKLISEKSYTLKTIKIESILPYSFEEPIEDMKQSYKNIEGIYLLINSKSVIKSQFVFQKANILKTYSMYNEELKKYNSFIKNKYTFLTKKHSYSLGTIFNTYFVPLDIIDVFKKLASRLNTHLKNVDLLFNYLNLINNENKNNCVVSFASNDNSGIFVLTYQGQVINDYSFEYNSLIDLNKFFITTMAKYEIELDKIKIYKTIVYGANKDFEKLGYKLPIIYKKSFICEDFKFNRTIFK